MGSLFSKRRSSRKKVKEKRPKRRKNKVVVSQDSESSSSSSSQSSHNSFIEKRVKQYNTKLSQDDLTVQDFEDYVNTRKKKSTTPKPIMSASDFERKCIDAHNKHRKNHGVPSLSKKSELSKHAQQWAKYIAKSGDFKHSKNKDYGENIAMTSNKNPSGK